VKTGRPNGDSSIGQNGSERINDHHNSWLAVAVSLIGARKLKIKTGGFLDETHPLRFGFIWLDRPLRLAQEVEECAIRRRRRIGE
jgi:hypothetical protein